MAINPFKNTDLNDLQESIWDFISKHFDGLIQSTKKAWKGFVTKGQEKITLMFIPHSEKKIVNFHISKFTISSIVGFIIITIIVTSILIINHSSTIKEVSKLEKYRSNSRVQMVKYKEEINKLYAIFQQFKPEFTLLYKLTPGSNIDALWAKGGTSNQQLKKVSPDYAMKPPIEILNIQEIETDLKNTKKILIKIKKFLKYRKKIIENTPSIWPTNGFIVSRYGKRNSPYSFKQEIHNGIDIEAFPGTDIRATAPGKVSNVSWHSKLGLTISIKHKYGFVTRYSHCQRVTVEIGQKIQKNEVIGYVGRTGKTTRYTCFYQIMIGTEFVDPMPYLNRITF